MTNAAHDGSNYAQRVAERLFSLRQAGIIKPRWIASKVAAEAENTIEQFRGSGPKSKGLFSRLVGLFKKSKTAAEEAKAFSEQLLALLEDGRVTTQDGFTRQYLSLADTRAKRFAVSRVLRLTWLDGIDLPLDAVEDHRFEDVLAASLYRFAYGRDRSVNFVGQIRASEGEGIYVTYLKDTGSGLLERRLLAYSRVGSDLGRTLAIRAVELSRENGKLIVRSGVVVPNQGHDAFTLSGAVDAARCQTWLQHWAGSEEPLFEAAPPLPETDEGLLPLHRLGFVTLRQRSPSEVVGAFVDGERFGQVTGRKLEDGQLDAALIATIGRLGQADADALSVDDRNLIAAMPRYAERHGSHLFGPDGPSISD